MHRASGPILATRRTLVGLGRIGLTALHSHSFVRSSEQTIEFIDQAPHDLRLFVVDGPIDLEQFTILKEDIFAWNGMSVRVAIIGESHFVSLQSPNGNLSEICGCTTLQPDSRSDVLADIMPVSLSDSLHYRFGDTDYSFTTSYLTEGSGEGQLREFAEVCTRTIAKAPKFTANLHLQFPSDDESMPDPQTHLLAEYEDDLVIRTAHSYPPYRTIVFTRSRLSRRQA